MIQQAALKLTSKCLSLAKKSFWVNPTKITAAPAVAVRVTSPTPRGEGAWQWQLVRNAENNFSGFKLYFMIYPRFCKVFLLCSALALLQSSMFESRMLWCRFVKKKTRN